MSPVTTIDIVSVGVTAPDITDVGNRISGVLIAVLAPSPASSAAIWPTCLVGVNDLGNRDITWMRTSVWGTKCYNASAISLSSINLGDGSAKTVAGADILVGITDVFLHNVVPSLLKVIRNTLNVSPDIRPARGISSLEARYRTRSTGLRNSILVVAIASVVSTLCSFGQAFHVTSMCGTNKLSVNEFL